MDWAFTIEFEKLPVYCTNCYLQGHENSECERAASVSFDSYNAKKYMENIRVEKQRTPLNTAPTYIPRRQNAEISEPIVSEPLIFVNQICTSSKPNRLVEMVSSNNA